ncbi:hypothetical protein Ancab_009273 [Ancistrocladus abbreviatus]
MASSDSGGGGAGLTDSSVGSIVWVRRRNGSWWPGKILGPDELSATYVMSPRSGTPVKLLGREDASVDWYNLEKSKRVKAFRCGDFDDCIERAEASQGMPPKKREKYARREDAILHALELEKQLLDKKYGNLGPTTNSMNHISFGSATKDFATSSGTLGNGNGNFRDHELNQVLKKIDSYTEYECYSNPFYREREKEGAQLGLEHDNSEVSTRTRGLPDFGQRTSPSQPMGSLSIALNGGEHYGNHSHVKTGRFVYLPAEFDDLADTNEGPHNQMEMPVSHPGHSNLRPRRHPGAFAGETSSGSSEDTESDSSETDSMERDVDTELTTLSDANTNAEARSRARNRLAFQRQLESTSSEDVSSPDDASHFHFHNPISSSMGFSKWELKGKRNIRNLTRRSMDFGFTHRVHLGGGRRSFKQMTRGRNLSYYHDNDDYINEDFIEDDLGFHMEGFGKRGYLSKFRALPGSQNFLSKKFIDWEELMWGDRPFRGFLVERGDYFNPAYVGRHGHDMLIDVDLKVQAKKQGEHVPWVSLMSKLDGKAIIGHPIQIETLEDGSTDVLLSTTDAFSNCGYNNDGNRVPPVWGTARTTANFRVRQPHLSAQPEGGDPDSPYFDQDGKWQFKKSAATSSVHKKNLSRKSLSHVPRPLLQQMKKPIKKANLSTSQKTRTLSSIGNNRRLCHRARGTGSNHYLDEVIKPLVSGPPTVACIPVKLVFSRLLEAVGRPPSGPAKHGVFVNSSNKERFPIGTCKL